MKLEIANVTQSLQPVGGGYCTTTPAVCGDPQFVERGPLLLRLASGGGVLWRVFFLVCCGVCALLVFLFPMMDGDGIRDLNTTAGRLGAFGTKRRSSSLVHHQYRNAISLT